MNTWNMVIDIAKCHSCNNCFLACKDEFFANAFPPLSAAQPRHGHRWIDILRRERGQYPKMDVAYLPKPCMHCEEADCIKAAQDGAVYRRDDGIVIIDPQKARGQKAVVESCPYGVIFWNEELDLPQKCTFCAHLLDDGWGQPRCVQACPTGALEFFRVEDSEMQQRVQSEQLQTLHPEYRLEPRVYYKNLHRYDKCFIAGSVASASKDECLEGAKIAIKDRSGKVIGSAVTDNYGDFKFDDLEGKGSAYDLEVEAAGSPGQKLHLDLQESINLGTIFL